MYHIVELTFNIAHIEHFSILVLSSLKTVTKETPAVPWRLRRTSLDPRLGPQIELSCGNVDGLLNLIGIGKTLPGEDITPNEPPPALL